MEKPSPLSWYLKEVIRVTGSPEAASKESGVPLEQILKYAHNPMLTGSTEHFQLICSAYFRKVYNHVNQATI